MTSTSVEAIRAYLESLGRPKKRGRKPAGIEALQRRLERVQADIPHAKPLQRLHLLQQEIELKDRIRALTGAHANPTELEDAFVAEVAEWADRKNVSWQALRAAGVPSGVLRRAGMTP